MTPYRAVHPVHGEVVVVCDWSNMRLAAQPTAMVDVIQPDGTVRRYVVPLSELKRCEDASKTG